VIDDGFVEHADDDDDTAAKPPLSPVMAARAASAAAERDASRAFNPDDAFAVPSVDTFAPGAATADDEPLAVPPSPIAAFVSNLKTSRKHQAIVGGAAGLLVIVMALAFCGGGSKKSTQVVAKNTAATKAPPEPPPEKPPEPPPAEPTNVAAAEPGSGETPVSDTPPAEGTGPTAEELAAMTADTQPVDDQPTGKSNPNANANANANASTSTAVKKNELGGKQVVLESDAQATANQPAAAPASEQGAIKKARAAYSAGNQKLFAGDPAGAIKFYRQALAYYPGYVAGYRGLGLAYERQGDKTNALKALRMYVSSVPSAKDTPLIRKRIASLQK